MPTYKYNETVTLTATDTECCVFDYWALSDDPCEPVSYENPLVIAANTNASYIAKFKKKKFKVNVTSSFPELVTITGNGTYTCGEDVRITATYPNCLDIYWSDKDLQPSTTYSTNQGITTLTYTITSISSDFYGTLIGEASTAHVSVSPCPSEGGEAGIVYFPSLQNNNLSCGTQTQWSVCEHAENGCSVGTEGDFLCGDIITLVAKPNEECEFNGWSIGVCDENEICLNLNYVSTNPIFTTSVCNDTNYLACFSCKEPPHDCLSLTVVAEKPNDDFCYLCIIKCDTEEHCVSMSTGDTIYFPYGCDVTLHTYYIYPLNENPNPPLISADGFYGEILDYGYRMSGDCCTPYYDNDPNKYGYIHSVYSLGAPQEDLTLISNQYIAVEKLEHGSSHLPFINDSNIYTGDLFCKISGNEYLGCHQGETTE